MNNYTSSPNGNGCLICMQKVVKAFDTGAVKVTVLKGIDLSVAPGEFLSIVGRSGSGKSTLLNMLTGIDHPTSGSVEITGTRLHTLSESSLASWRGRNMGIVFQFFQLLPMLSLVENVMLPMDFCDFGSPAEREPRAMGLLKRVGLEAFAHKLPGAVSGGQQQSAAVARALATDPPILVADEPTGNLDSRTAAEMMALFHELVTGGKTIVMVTHDALLARQTGRSLILSDGEIIHPAVAAAFPGLNHQTLLKIHHLAREVTLPAGAEIPGEIQLAVVAEGEVQTGAGAYPPGKLLSSAGMRKAGLTPRAGTKGLSLLALDEASLRSMLEGHPAREGH